MCIRDRESCGIAVCRDGVMNCHRDAGLVNEVFTGPVLKRLGTGHIAIGHVRYGTTGDNPRLNAQPLAVDHMKGCMALAHNGNLINDEELRGELEAMGSIFHTSSDTEVISYNIIKECLPTDTIEEAVCRADVYKRQPKSLKRQSLGILFFVYMFNPFVLTFVLTKILCI